ncbi:MAG: hypothetical protein WD336_00515 [Trueperaceae bacterium]
MPYGRRHTGPYAAIDLVPVFEHQLTHSNLTAGESVVIVTDTAFDPVHAAACLGAAQALGAHAQIVTLPARATVLPRAFGPMLAASDLIVGATTHLLHYRDDVRAALDGGARALLAMQPPHALERLRADPEVIERTQRGARRLDGTRTVRIRSPHGTDLTLDVRDRPALAHYGVADRPGHLDFWGSAMVEIAQHEDATNGTLVLAPGDLTFHLGRFVEAPVTIHVEAGRIVRIEGGLDAILIREQLASYRDPNAWIAGHIAWGTDPRARWTAPLVQFPDAGTGNADSEGRLGAVQVQFGSNDDRWFRGANASAAHFGLCTLGASVDLDGTTVIEDGVLLEAVGG